MNAPRYSVRAGAIKWPSVADRAAAVLAAKDADSPFTAGHLDGLADATNGNPRDPSGRFKRWHHRRPESHRADYERGYTASWEQVRAALEGSGK